ncbi:hypothetical protein [Longimicrobium sp.]|uniref:hypothetical protein n=1 Tax=Longimicrobium sp. TaxID=2029185 RepID=UPI002BC7494C|nr:hypothetical protein [Longimicrobium sp.]HSU13020.1 hypothetical protein [Longimicrobium sp.]
MTNGNAAAVSAHVVLPGHADTIARVDVDAVPFRARLLRTLVMAGAWGAISAAMFFITVFDPFMTSMPVLVGAVTVWRNWKGRYRVRGFQGACPRCGAEMRLKENTRVAVPHPLVCYACHHEPQLVLRAA